MRTFLALSLLATAAAAQDGFASRPVFEPPRFVVAPPKLPAPPAVEMPARERAQPADSVNTARGSTPPAVLPNEQQVDALQRARAALHERVDLTTVDGRLWARGRGYKASFGSEGCTFIPFLGSDAPRNYPVTFALASIRSADGDIALDAHAAAVRAGERVTLDRGFVDEVYAPSVDGIEQSFVIERRPASGACVLRVSVASELAFDASADSIRFANERGGVNIGQAFAVSADGSKLALPTEFVDGAIEIRLADELLAKARYPLVIDPIFSPFTIPAGPFGAQPTVGIDVAYDESTNRALYVTEEVYSATDHDALATLVSSTGVFQAAHYFDFTSDDWVGLKVATYADYDEFLTVASVRPSSGGVRKIRGALFRPVLPLTWNSPFDIASGADALINPDVGGDPFPGASYFCVVWERVKSTTDHDIEYCTIDELGALSNVGAVLDNSAGTYDAFPRISKSNLTTFWNCAWQRGVPGGDHDIYGASLNYFGGSVLPSHGMLVYAAFDDTYPVITANLHTGERAVFELWNSGGNNTIYTTMMTGTTPGTVFNVPQTAAYQQTALAVDTDARRIFLTYVDTAPVGLADARVSEFQRVEGSWSAVWWEESYSYPASSVIGNTCVATRQSGGGTSRNPFLGGIAGYPTQLTYPIALTYEGAPTDSFNLYTAPVCFGSGPGATACPCGNNGASGRGCASSTSSGGAVLYAQSVATIENDTFSIRGQYMPPGGGALYFQGTALQAAGAGIAFGDGLLCLGGAIVRLGVEFNAFGESQYPGFGEPTISMLGGITEPTTRYYQAWYRDSDPSFCTAATYNLTNALRVTWLW